MILEYDLLFDAFNLYRKFSSFNCELLFRKDGLQRKRKLKQISYTLKKLCNCRLYNCKCENLHLMGPRF